MKLKTHSKTLLIFILFFLLNTSSVDAGWIKQLANWVSKSWRPVHGTYAEGGSTNRNAPLTTFDRNPKGFASDREMIKNKIVNEENDYKQIYLTIYNNAKDGDPDISCGDEDICAAATIAKNAAFVYLMGFDKNGNDLDETTTPKRSEFYDKAVFVLRKCNDDERYGSFAGKDMQHRRAEELIMLLQAHDYLMMAKSTGLTYDDGDREDAIESLVDFTHRLYRHSNNFGGALDAYQNMTLKVAAAIGMAAVVLSDQGTYFWLVQKKPERWANAAHAYINRTLWTGSGVWPANGSKGPMSDRSDPMAGYAEGPHYFAYGMDCLLPFFISFNNFVNRDMEGKYYTSALNFSGETVRNYKYDPGFDELYKWYNTIRMPNQNAPCFDDSWSDANTGTLALTRKQEHNVVTQYKRLKIENREPDYLASFNPPAIPSFDSHIENYSEIIVRTPWTTPLSQAHYLYLNGERGSALNGHRNLLWYKYGHEHADAASFIISAGEDVLAIDPGYRGFDHREEMNAGHHHNVITLDGDGPDEMQETSQSVKRFASNYTVTALTVFKGWPALIDEKAKQIRETEVNYDGGGTPYYIINDYVVSKESSSMWAQFNLNGNGLNAGADPSFHIEPGKDNVAIWDHPCKKDADSSDNWKMRATITTQIDGQTTSNSWNFQNGSTHGNNNLNYSDISDNNIKSALGNITNWVEDGYKSYGEHTRATKQLSINRDEVAHFKVTIEVLGCQDDTTESPMFVQTPEHTGHIVTRWDASGKVYNFHYSRAVNDHSPDTVINPFFFSGSSAVFGTDSRRASYSRGENTELRNGFCVTYTNFRKAGVEDGTQLEYDDTVYISSDAIISTQFQIIGKWQYKGYCTTTSATNVTYYLPDVQQGMEMTATGSGITSTYDTLTNLMTVAFPANSTSYFSFGLTDPCRLSCFYPDSATNVVTTFTHGDGSTQALGHKLKILQSDGRLNLYNGSKMSICTNKYLVNRDSLFLLNTYEAGTAISRCYPLAMGQQVEQSNRSAILINDGATLVLDSGSYTYVGANSTICVKSGGTLIIKRGAFVEIGSKEKPGRGEIIAEGGAFVCIQEGAHIQFYADETDTTDKNLFYVVLHDQINPFAVQSTRAGPNPYIINPLIDDMIMETEDAGCAEFCDLPAILPPWGIYNREWGYAPFALPLSTFKLGGDTLCKGDSVVIPLQRLLNEAGYQINVCRIPDTTASGSVCILGDTNAININTFPVSSDICVELQKTPENYRFRFWDTGWYRVHVSTINECGSVHDSIEYVYVPADPDVVFTATDEACPGYGTVIADGSGSISHVNHNKHRWTAVLITPDSITESEGEPIDYGADWEFDSSSVSDHFDFPGFKWIGGFKYAVGLTVEGWCGNVTKWDTINFPLMVIAGVHDATTYDDPVGPHAVQLEGFVSGASSWSWSPTDYLDYPDSLNPIATPPSSIIYILTGTSAGCSMSDTITINHNTLAYAGEDRNVCFDQKAVLGTSYNAAAYWGFVNYKTGRIFQSAGYLDFKNNHTETYSEDDRPIQKYFTQFLIEKGLSEDILQENSVTYLWNTHAEIWDAILNDIRFSTYFDLFMTNKEEAADYFENDLLGNHTGLKDSIDNLFLSSWWASASPSIFNDYYVWLFDHHLLIGGSPIDTVDIIWEKKINDTTWFELTDWRGYYNIVQDTTVTTTYRMTLIDNVNSLVEYDEVTVFVDSALVAGFTPAYQVDSSVYFINSTYEDNSTTRYKWYFGDGDSSDNVSPFHKFRAFDSVYYVCLTATNTCGSDTYCDSVVVDSSGLISGGFSKKGDAGDSLGQSIVSSTKKLVQNTHNKNENYLSVNVPNPFSDLTTIEYATKDQNKNAEIRVTNILGQLVKTYQLPNHKGVIVIDGSGLKDGLYFYSLAVDNTICESKRMLVRH